MAEKVLCTYCKKRQHSRCLRKWQALVGKAHGDFECTCTDAYHKRHPKK